jgi:adenylosuccinate lyase
MTSPAVQSSLLTPLISSAAMRAILNDRARVQRMLDFEVALARAEAAVGIVPALAIDRIAAAAHAKATTSTRSAKRPWPPAISPSR